MKNLIFLSVIIIITNSIMAQHKSLTFYYPGDSVNVVSVTNLDSMTIFICGASNVNYGGINYNTVLIGEQCWLKENLNIGTMINSYVNSTNNGVIEKYCFANDVANCSTYGGLYQWNEAMQYVETAGTKGICPVGWHIPTLLEFQALQTEVNNNGNSLKAVGQGSEGGIGTNESGFTALLAGSRDNTGNFGSFGMYVDFWSSTKYNVTEASYMYLAHYISNIGIGNYSLNGGFSIRCLRD